MNGLFFAVPGTLQLQPALDFGGKGARILDIGFGMADFFFADPGVGSPCVLFGFALDIELGTTCSFHDMSCSGTQRTRLCEDLPFGLRRFRACEH